MTYSNKILQLQKDYREQMLEAIRTDMAPMTFKKYSGALGVYPQRSHGHYMIRPRTPSGVVTYEQLVRIYELATSYASKPLHLTTRQSFQFHGVLLKDTWSVMEGLLEVGIITLGAGGNSIRNIAIPPLAGLDPEEVFDVTPYALAATDFALNLDGLTSLPRKYKIAFSGDDRDQAKAKLADLGFIATYQDGRPGFTVYGGGGGGNDPKMGLLLREFTEAKDVNRHIQAMMALFKAYGDTENRMRARIRYIRDRLGDPGFIKTYEAFYQKTEEIEPLLGEAAFRELTFQQGSPLYVNEDENRHDNKKSENSNEIPNGISNNAYEHLLLKSPGGDFLGEDLKDLIEFLAPIQDRISLRLSPVQGLLVRSLHKEEVAYLKSRFKNYMVHHPFQLSLGCIGARQCAIGRQDSQGLITNLLTWAKDLPKDKLDKLPEMRVSGCKNGCALHQLYSIGFEGGGLKKESGLVAAYHVYLGGKPEGKEMGLGRIAGTLLPEDIPGWLMAYLDLVQDVENVDQNRMEASLRATLKDYSQSDF